MTKNVFSSVINDRIRKSKSYLVPLIPGINILTNITRPNGQNPVLQTRLISATTDNTISRSIGSGYDHFLEKWDEILNAHATSKGYKRIPPQWKKITPPLKDYRRILRNAKALYDQYYDDDRYQIKDDCISGNRNCIFPIPLVGLSMSAHIQTYSTLHGKTEHLAFCFQISHKRGTKRIVKAITFSGYGDAPAKFDEALKHYAKAKSQHVNPEWRKLCPQHKDLTALEEHAWSRYYERMDKKKAKPKRKTKAA